MPTSPSIARRWPLVGLVLFIISRSAFAGEPAAASQKPNVIVIIADDLGYGDLSCYGSTKIRTPRLDRLASEGTRFTSFYAQPVCGPSRAAFLTGRQPIRSGGWSVPTSEVTLAELFHQAGYATACVGKWDISDRKPILDRMPLAQGFDSYYGPLGANDNGEVELYENNAPAGATKDMASLSRLYTDKAISLIKQHKDHPFYLHLAHTMVHVVLDASPDFKGKSGGGLYGDAVEELDFHIGRLLDALDEAGVADHTLVVFFSDNGPWNNHQEVLLKANHGAIAWGSAGPLREGKGSTYEGGFRVPCLVRWPGHVPAGRASRAILSTLDFLPTFGALAGYEPPNDRPLDGVNQFDLLLGKNETGARDDFYYFSNRELQAVRGGKWKLLLPNRRDFWSYVKDRGSKDVELYDLESDISESKNLAADHPEIVQELKAKAAAWK